MPSFHASRRPFLIAGVALVAVGLLLTVTGAWNGWNHAASRNWPSVPGVLEEWEDTGRGRSASLRVAYGYSVNGRSYRGNLISFVTSPEDRAAIRALQPGERVTVHHHPRHPQTAVLIPSTGESPLVGLLGSVAIGLVPLGMGALFLYGTVKGPLPRTGPPGATS